MLSREPRKRKIYIKKFFFYYRHVEREPRKRKICIKIFFFYYRHVESKPVPQQSVQKKQKNISILIRELALKNAALIWIVSIRRRV